ncbi:uncharacterized protein TNCV_2000821 [Trichonephila clavipes]|nr:uncharacterized protein TNCV_2000821 [Trichonephila clavipes]
MCFIYVRHTESTQAKKHHFIILKRHFVALPEFMGCAYAKRLINCLFHCGIGKDIAGLQTGRPGFDARCHQIPSECTRSTCSLNQWVRSLVGLFTSAGTGEYFPPLQFTCRNCGGGDRGRGAIYRPFGEVSLSLNRTVTCMVLKANDRRTSCRCHDESRGPRSDYVRQVALATTTTVTEKVFCDQLNKT